MKKNFLHSIYFVVGFMCIFFLLYIYKVQFNDYERTEREVSEDWSLDENVGLVGYDESRVCVSRVNDDAIVYYSLKEGDGEEMYQSKADVIVFEEIYKNALIVCEYDDSDCFVVKKIEEKKEEEILTGNCYGYPRVKLLDDKLMIGYDVQVKDQVMQSLICYDLEQKKTDLIAEYTYQFNEDGSITGELLQAFDGVKENMVVEVISFRNEDMLDDETGSVKLAMYDFKRKEFSDLPIYPERKLTYVWGDGKIVITSDYANKEPLNRTGNVYFKDDGSYDRITLKGVETSNDIKGASRIDDDTVIIETMNDIYILNTDYRRYKRIKNVWGIRFYKNSFGYINEKGKIEIYDFGE